MRSIRARLLLLLAAVVLLVQGAAVVITFFSVRHEIEEIFDAQLAQNARLLTGMLDAGQDGEAAAEIQQALNAYHQLKFSRDSEEYNEFGHAYEQHVAIQAWDLEQQRLFHSMPTPLAISKLGYGEQEHDGHLWRTFTLFHRSRDIWLQVAQEDYVRDEITIDAMVEPLVLQSVVIIPVMLLLCWGVVSRGLRPLRSISHQVASRDAKHLRAIEAEQVPNEVAAVVNALNDLMQDIAESLAREKRFLADAAHELKTPITALQLHAELAQQNADPSARLAACQQVKACTQRVHHLLQQMLQLSRVDLERSQVAIQAVDLKALVIAQIQQIYPVAEQANITLGLDADKVPAVAALPQDLPALIGNLLDNAILYTPEGGEVRVSLQVKDDAVEMDIDDSGPGIPPDQYSRVFERFYRVLGTEKPGSGLGLAIAREVMVAIGGTIELSPSVTLGGLCVICRFQLADNCSI